jgi:WhiB family redox-sensing transcriptional regulator
MIRHPVLLTLVPGLVRTGEESSWQDLAMCTQTDPDAFYPELGESTGPARAVCRICPVSAPCLQYAIDNGEEWGIWGGLSERERRGLRRDPAGRDLCKKELHLMEGGNVLTDAAGVRRCAACKAASQSRRNPAPRKAAA